MDILQAIQKLANQNQRLVDKYGVSDLTRLNDDIRNVIIDFYMKTKSYERDLERLNFEYSGLLDEITKYKLFLSIFGLPVQRIANLHLDILKIIDRENITKKYGETVGFFSIEFLFIEVEKIQTEIRLFMYPLREYYENPSTMLRDLYPNHQEFFNVIDNIEPNDLRAFDNIYHEAYKYIVSRLTHTEIQIHE